VISIKKKKNSHLSCKKGIAQSDGPMQKGQDEKAVKFRWLPRNGCDGNSVAKI